MCFLFFNDTATTEIYTYCTLFPYTTLFRSVVFGRREIAVVGQDVRLQRDRLVVDGDVVHREMTRRGVLPAERVEWLNDMPVEADRAALSALHLAGQEAVEHQREVPFHHVELLVADFVAAAPALIPKKPGGLPPDEPRTLIRERI